MTGGGWTVGKVEVVAAGCSVVGVIVVGAIVVVVTGSITGGLVATGRVLPNKNNQ